MLLAIRSPWLCALFAVVLLALAVTAQDSNTNNNNNNNQNTNPSNNNNNNNNAVPNAAELASSASASSASEAAASSSSSEDDNKETSSAQNSQTRTESAAVITPTAGQATSTNTGNAPVITNTNTATATNDAPDGTLPAVSGVIGIVTPSVPPTANAPFMRQSSLPEGTVFIIVGAILGFMGVAVLSWRAIVAWSLHRSSNRNAMQHPSATDKKLAIPAPFYSQYRDQGSTISLSGANGKSNKKNFKSPDLSAPSTSTLFFSPTAAGASMSALNTNGNRSSGYLPSGYYGGPATGSQTHLGMGNAINMSTLRPDANRDSQRISKATSWAPSPPDSPGMRASTAMKSSSTLNLALPPGDHRTPSLCLDDLLDGEGGVLAPGVTGTGPGGVGVGHWREHERRASSNLGPNGARRPSTAGRPSTSNRPGTSGTQMTRSDDGGRRA